GVGQHPAQQDPAAGRRRVSRLASAQHHRQDHEARAARALLGRPQRPHLRTLMSKPELRSNHLFTLSLTVDSNMTDVGETPYGRRRIAAVTGGTFEGEEIRGTVMPSRRSSSQSPPGDGITVLNVR